MPEQILTNKFALVIMKVCSIAIAFIVPFCVLRDINCESFDELDTMVHASPQMSPQMPSIFRAIASAYWLYPYAGTTTQRSVATITFSATSR